MNALLREHNHETTIGLKYFSSFVLHYRHPPQLPVSGVGNGYIIGPVYVYPN